MFSISEFKNEMLRIDAKNIFLFLSFFTEFFSRFFFLNQIYKLRAIECVQFSPVLLIEFRYMDYVYTYTVRRRLSDFRL